VDGSSHTIKTYGEAMDSADKATNKAMSAAYKYAAIQSFCIPTEGDHDADKTTHEVAAKVPGGFDDMVADLEIVANEQGVEALQAAWKGAKPQLRKHLTDTNKSGWEAIKAKAVAFDAAKVIA
jgi:predicted outer membrane protein